MLYSITNGTLSLKASSRGAEMYSLMKDGKEYLWTADPEYWPEHAPVLFPFIGRERNGEYRTGGRTYSMPIHGFAKNMDFEPEEISGEELRFTIRDTETTREVYPFPFLFTVAYRLEGNTVKVSFIVKNTGDSELYFMAGGHPGFLCPPPSHPGSPRSACGISFLREGKPLDAVYSTPITAEGLAASKEKEPYVFVQKDGRIIPEADLFANDALITENWDCDEVDLLDPDGRPYIRVSFDAPLVGVWSVAGREAPYICIEPWWGRCDREDFAGELKDREWEQALAPGKTAVYSFAINIPD